MTANTEIGAISVRIAADTGDLTKGLERARASLGDAGQSMSEGLRAVERSAQTAFDAFSSSIERAASGGRVSMRDMVDSILSDLRRLAVKTFITGPLENILSSTLGSALNFGGARASGGPVSANRAFLVGERGPELFVPSQGGAIVPRERLGGAAPIIFNVQATDAQSFMRSQTQIAAMLTRATMRGQRNL